MKLKMVVLIALIFVASALYASERKVYVVQKGDTLSDVAVTLRIQRVDVSKLWDWNPTLSRHTIVPGQEIVYFTPDTPLPEVSKEQAAVEMSALVKEMTERDAERDHHSEIIFLMIFITIALLSVGGFVLYGVRVRRSREAHSTEMVPVAPVQSFEQSVVDSNQQLINPTLETIRTVAKTGRRTIPYIFRLIPKPERNLMEKGDFNCEAIFREADDIDHAQPQVRFSGEHELRRWAKVPSHAQELAREARAYGELHQSGTESSAIH